MSDAVYSKGDTDKVDSTEKGEIISGYGDQEWIIEKMTVWMRPWKLDLGGRRGMGMSAGGMLLCVSV